MASQSEGTIIVGVDGSEHARQAVYWACDEADRRGWFLRIVFADTKPPKQVPLWYAESKTGITASEAVVDDALGLVATRNPGVVVSGETVVQAPSSALTKASRSADLLVVGARGTGGFKGLLLGSVSDQCIQYAHCPVVVVADGPDELPDHRVPRIVVGIDGSFGSSLALKWALEEARVRSASVEALYAWQYPPIGGFVLGPTEGFEAAGQELVDGADAFRNRWASDVAFQAVSHFGDPVVSLVSASQGADLLVVGSSGHGAFREAVLGSVAHQCARHGRGAVVVIRPPVSSDMRLFPVDGAGALANIDQPS